MEKFYQSLLTYINNHPHLKKMILFVYKYFPYITFFIYPCILLFAFFSKNDILLSIILRPLLAFVFVTIFRKIINRPRPYESMNIVPLQKHKKGESFPSRHTLSAFVIALACFEVNSILGIITIIIALFISLSRILAGVHYISDVITAIIIAFIFYII